MNNSSVVPIISRTHDAFYSRDIFEKGIGWVIVARFKSGGQRIETGVFCVNVWCLGVKIACYDEWTRATFQSHIIDHYFSKFPMTEIEPCCARKLVEQSVQYAAQLGFAPHSEYKKACRVFGGIHAQDCAREFVFGQNSKPYYRRGPSESEERALQIVRQLEWRCGKGNFDYDVILGTVEEVNRFLGEESP